MIADLVELAALAALALGSWLYGRWFGEMDAGREAREQDDVELLVLLHQLAADGRITEQSRDEMAVAWTAHRKQQEGRR